MRAPALFIPKSMKHTYEEPQSIDEIRKLSPVEQFLAFINLSKFTGDIRHLIEAGFALAGSNDQQDEDRAFSDEVQE